MTSLPRNGSVVIIEDNFEEALPLIQLLSKNGIATTFYMGGKDDFPLAANQTVRLVFLDLQLAAPPTSEDTLATMHISNLKKIIPRDNGPYILVLWSQRINQYADRLKEEISKKGNGVCPAFVLQIDKDICFRRDIENPNLKNFKDQVNAKLKTRFGNDDLTAVENAVHEVFTDQFPERKIPKKNAIKIIENELKRELKKAGVFHLFVIWENLINESARTIVNDYAGLFDYEPKYWNDNLRHVFYKLAYAQLGEQILRRKPNEVFINALKTFNNSFIDKTDSGISVQVFPKHLMLSTKGHVFAKEDNGKVFQVSISNDGNYSVCIDGNVRGAPKDTIEKLIKNTNDTAEKAVLTSIAHKCRAIAAEINTRLLVDMHTSNKLQPGNVYKKNVAKRKKREYLVNYFKKETLERKNGQYQYDADAIDFIEIEVSPICDYAQNKWQRSRFISGIMIPADYSSRLLDSKALYYYEVIPVFEIKGAHRKMIFDCRFLKSKSKDNRAHDSRSLMFRIKGELLIDILARISSHMNRPGVVFVD
jgi:hypothetical protein